ncbi:hypothetical protein ABD87_23025 [Lysinibacillus sphaericus]|nr:hypothetical protein [Lysinibacillus sphaericus]
MYKNTQLLKKEFKWKRKNLSLIERLLNYLIGAWFLLFGIPMICYTFHYLYWMYSVIFTFINKKPITHFYQESHTDFLGIYFGCATPFLILCSIGYILFYRVHKRKQKKREEKSRLQSSFPI